MSREISRTILDGAGQLFGHGDLIRFFPLRAEDIAPYIAPTLVFFRLGPLRWPEHSPGRYDALKVTENEGTRQRVYDDWDDDVFAAAG